MRPTEITLAVFEKYKPEELAEVAQKMAQAVSSMEAAESEKKVSDGVFNERIKTHAAEVSELAQKYNKGGETAQIGCTIRYDIPVVGQKSYIRMDTEETVEVHDMSLNEKQETLQFPLSTTASDAPKPKKRTKVQDTPDMPEVPQEPPVDSPPPTEITFKDIQSIAAHIARMPVANHEAAMRDMQTSLAMKLLKKGSVIGPDGRIETIETAETADKLAQAWLKLAIEEATKPPAAEEVTRICPYPGCILFTNHDGMHEFPQTDAKPVDAPSAPEPQPEKDKPKPKRRRGYASPDDEIQPGAPA